MKAALADKVVDALYRTGLYRLFAPGFAGVGTVLTFHRLQAARDDAFQPNRGLEVAPEFFRAAVRMLREQGFEFVTIGEAHRRLMARAPMHRFVCLTFDDGYRDNYEYLLPLCRELSVSATIYVTTGFVERQDVAWWIALERLIAARQRVVFSWVGHRHELETATAAQKSRAFANLADLFRPANREVRRMLADAIGRENDMDLGAATADVFMTRDMVRELDTSGLCEIGAHTVSHPLLAAQDENEAIEEMRAGRAALEDWLGRPVPHFAYPFGQAADASAREFTLARDAGFTTAATTQNGNLMAGHRDHLWSLPRIDISGRRQNLGAVKVLMSGTVSAILRALGRPDPA